MSDIIIREPDDAEYEVVRKYIDEFWLDKAYMHKGQFRILLFNGAIAAFARIKKHRSCTELCTLGVVKKLRGRHIGMVIVNGILAGIKKEVYIVTVIPDYFRKIGFHFAKEFPVIIRKKLDNCRNNYSVGETYRVMKWGKSRVS
jgi:N-acetylglutamate synthase-like GNAT family acetyltransferase